MKLSFAPPLILYSLKYLHYNCYCSSIFAINFFRMIKIDFQKIKEKDINLIVEYFLKEKVIIMPTDTVLGLSCLATSAKAINKINKIKNRPQNMPLLVLIKSYCMLHDYFFVNKKQEQYIRSVWPRTTREAHNFDIEYQKRPATFILKDRKKFAKNITCDNKGVGVRLPKNDFFIKIIKRINIPIVSTSLNFNKKKPLNSLRDVKKHFKILPDLAVDVGTVKTNKTSRIIDIRDMNNIRIIRK